MDKHEKSKAMTERLKQVDRLLYTLRFAVADIAPEYWQRRALYEAIDGIRNGLTADLKPIWEEHPTNEYNLSQAWGVLSAWDDESDEKQQAERKAALKKRFKERRTPNDQ